MSIRKTASHISKAGAERCEQTRRHEVLNNYQSVIALIVNESAQASEPKVKAALNRVAERVYELASIYRG